MRKKNIFTLIELIVIITIIAIMTSLLMTAMKYGQDMLISTECVHNQKQAISAQLNFSSDHQNKFIISGHFGYPGWAGILYSPVAAHNKEEGLGYFTDPSIAVCPSTSGEVESDTNFFSSYGSWGYAANTGGASYSLKSAYRVLNEGLYNNKERENFHIPYTMSEDPSLMTFTIDTLNPYELDDCQSSYYMLMRNNTSLKHRQKAVASFLDGRVDTLDETQFLNGDIVLQNLKPAAWSNYGGYLNANKWNRNQIESGYVVEDTTAAKIDLKK